MAYDTGSASSFADLLGALDSFLSANGWATSAGDVGRILSKGSAYVNLSADADSLSLLAGTGAASGELTGQSPDTVKIASPGLAPIVFPITFDFHLFDDPDEVYVVISYGGNRYQHLNFGVSDVPGVGGTGLWATATLRGAFDVSTWDGIVYITSAPSYLYAWPNVDLGYFVGGVNTQAAQFVHHGLDSGGWAERGNGSAGNLLGIDSMAGLLNTLPSAYNEAEILLPIHGILRRPDDVQTIVVVPRHARFMRNDNVTPGEVISYGADDWRSYPLYAKNTAARNGVGWNVGALHSGTYAVAIRYEG